MKKSVRKRAQEAMEKYKPTTEKTNNAQNNQPVPHKYVPNESNKFTPKPDKKRG